MSDLFKVIKNANPQILFLAVLLFMGVGYSIYQMAGAFSGQEEAPEYRRSPPAAFAVPTPITIIEAPKIDEPRLPDHLYEELTAKTASITEAVAAQSINQTRLRKEGMSARESNRVLAELNNLYEFVGRRSATYNYEFILQKAALEEVEIGTYFTYSEDQYGSPEVEVNVIARYLYDLRQNRWILYTLQVQE